MTNSRHWAPWGEQPSPRLAELARKWVQEDHRRIVIVGAGGWIGRVTLALLCDALGVEAFSRRVVCFGSSYRDVLLDGGVTVRQWALTELSSLDAQPSLLFHLAFLTKDKLTSMDADEYVARNRELSREVFQALDVIGVDRLFVASSGAAASAHDPTASPDLRLYGQLKLEDEGVASAWAQADCGRRAAIGRIFNLSGPYINKVGSYALSNFILDAIAQKAIEVRAPMRVTRSYVSVRELVSLVFCILLDSYGEAVLEFETGGEPLELAEVANFTAKLLGSTVRNRPIASRAANYYVGNDEKWQSLLEKYGMIHMSISQQIAETACYLSRKP